MPAPSRCLLGVDLGAGALKASVVDESGTLLGEAAHPITTSTPHFLWSEQDPSDWYRALCAAVPRALAAAGIEASRIAGVGFSAGAHIGVLVDEHDAVIRPALLWNDQRAAAQARELHERAGARIIELSLNRANPTWLLPQLLWLRQHEPEAIARVRRLYIAKDWLRSRLCGTWHTDFSDVVGALMADRDTRGWSSEICALIDWPMTTLPPVVEPTAVVGAVTPAAAAATGLCAGTPVVCGSNDTTVESWGVGAVHAGQAVVKLATAGVLYSIVDHARVDPPISCYPHVLPGMYYTATGTNSCASAHRWLRDQVFLAEGAGDPAAGAAAFASMDALAAGIRPGADGLLFHPYLQGERAPYWDPLLRADFVGLTIGHTRAHFARALYEGIACSIRDLKEAAEALGASFGAIRLIGGGARSATWRQILCDVLALPIELPRNADASYGAALIAGVGVGVFGSALEAVERCVSIVDRHEPDPARVGFYAELFAIYKDAQRVLAPIDHRLHALAVQSARIT